MVCIACALPAVPVSAYICSNAASSSSRMAIRSPSSLACQPSNSPLTVSSDSPASVRATARPISKSAERSSPAAPQAITPVRATLRFIANAVRAPAGSSESAASQSSGSRVKIAVTPNDASGIRQTRYDLSTESIKNAQANVPTARAAASVPANRYVPVSSKQSPEPSKVSVTPTRIARSSTTQPTIIKPHSTMPTHGLQRDSGTAAEATAKSSAAVTNAYRPQRGCRSVCAAPSVPFIPFSPL